MKKIKKISVRVSSEDLEILISDYQRYKENPFLVEYLYKTKIETFSDYIRLMLDKGLNN